MVGAGGFTLRVKFVRYANRRILCLSCLRQGEPTRDRLMGFESHQLIVEKTDNTLCGCYLFLARPKGFEPPISRIGICCVIQLRHGRKCTINYNCEYCFFQVLNVNVKKNLWMCVYFRIVSKIQL